MRSARPTFNHHVLCAFILSLSRQLGSLGNSQVSLPWLTLTARHLNCASTTLHGASCSGCGRCGSSHLAHGSSSPKMSVRVLKGLSKASRECASRKLARILDVVVDKNDYTSWVCLLRFTASCLRYPGRGGRGSSLATAVNRQPREETDLQANEKPNVRTGHSPSNSPNDPAYSARTTRKAEAVAALAEERKVAKYVHLTPVHLFSPVAVETTGVFGPHTKALLKDLRSSSDDPDHGGGGSYYLPLPEAVGGSAEGNCAAVMGTTGQLDSGLFY